MGSCVAKAESGSPLAAMRRPDPLHQHAADERDPVQGGPDVPVMFQMTSGMNTKLADSPSQRAAAAADSANVR